MGCGCKKKSSTNKPMPDRTTQIREKLREIAKEQNKKKSK